MKLYASLGEGGGPEIPRPHMAWVGVFLAFAGVVWFLLWFASAPQLTITKEGTPNGHAGRAVLHDLKPNNVPHP